MFLRKLELYGFKSFADKTEFVFQPGITAVVGPNGSGKSNVADAIRWVLGEQSAKMLRGGKMEDVIFAGSEGKKPLGYAEVALTFDNSTGIFPLDYSEITISRRIFRSGESEYLINRVPCRLKDITDLIMDTGIGKDAYSIIGQGRIDEILSSKSEDRRLIFEEAAGIVKYKTRKKEAEKKLEETNQNLLRLTDVLTELERNLPRLAAEAERAETYKQYDDERAGIELALGVHQWQDLTRKIKDGEEKKAGLAEKLNERKGAIAAKERQLLAARIALEEIDRQIQALGQEIYAVESDITRSQGQEEVLKERYRHLTAKIAEMQSAALAEEKRRATLMERCLREEERLAALLKQKEEVADNGRAWQEQWNGLEEAFRRETGEMEAAKGEIIDLLNALAEGRNQMKSLAATKEAIERNRGVLATKIAELSSQLAGVERRMAEVQSALQENDERSLALQKEESRLLTEIRGLEKDRDRLLTDRTERRRFLETAMSRYQALSDMEKGFEGYQKGVKAVLLKAAENPRELPGICGPVTKLITVPPRLETAVEVALGGALQNIVTETEENARQAIEFLKRRDAGRATFLPLSAIRPRTLHSVEEKALRLPGVVGLAAKLVTADAKYSAVVSHLLGNIVVVEDLPQAIAIARQTNHQVRLVTLSGETIMPGGAMSGGSFHRSGFLSRSRELDELALRVENLQENVNQLEEEYKAVLSCLEEKRQSLQMTRARSEETEKNRISLQKDAEYLVGERERIAKQLSQLQREEEELACELNEVTLQTKEAAAGLETLEEKNTLLEENIKAVEQRIKELENLRSSLKEKMTQGQISLAAFAQEEKNTREKIAEIRQAHAEAAEKLSVFYREITELNDEIEKAQEESAALAAAQGDLQKRLLRLAEQKQKLAADRREAAENVARQEEELKTRREEVGCLQEEVHRAEVALTRLLTERENIEDNLFHNFGMTMEQVLKYARPVKSVRDEQRRLEELKDLMTSLGEVNLGAIAEYHHQKERHTFLLSQKQDLVEAQKSLYRVIEEMEHTMQRQFTETFVKVGEAFNHTFSRLFGGGKAKLFLVDPENVLESGVEIDVQPPGKKLQNLMLLSGGERALTAIALLFAVLKVRPTAFCVLDEIEAALDEANVDRFAEYLKEFAKTTQFIVITHRKGTMEAADVLYGITMEEPGISRLVSVRLSDRLAAGA